MCCRVVSPTSWRGQVRRDGVRCARSVARSVQFARIHARTWRAGTQFLSQFCMNTCVKIDKTAPETKLIRNMQTQPQTAARVAVARPPSPPRVAPSRVAVSAPSNSNVEGQKKTHTDPWRLKSSHALSLTALWLCTHHASVITHERTFSTPARLAQNSPDSHIQPPATMQTCLACAPAPPQPASSHLCPSRDLVADGR